MTQLEKAGEAWVLWNRKQITGEEFALRFRKLFPRITDKAWKRYCLKRKILTEMVECPKAHNKMTEVNHG